MRHYSLFACASFILQQSFAWPQAQVELKGTVSEGGVSQQRAAAVKTAFEHAWDGYYKYAFPNDELHPGQWNDENPLPK